MLPLMKKVNTGHIINISSIAGLAGIPEATAYAGTKFAVRGISQSLQREMKNTEIKVSTIFPGSVHTDFFDNYNGVQSNPTMLAAQDIAQSVIQILEMPDNALISELEIRPLNVKYS